MCLVVSLSESAVANQIAAVIAELRDESKNPK